MSLFLYLLSLTTVIAVASSSDTANDNCDITIWFHDNNVKGETIIIREGATMELTCQEKCQGEQHSFEQTLDWKDKNFQSIAESSGRRMYTEKTEDNMSLRLIFRAVSRDDVGKYLCRGKYTQGFVQISMDTQEMQMRSHGGRT